MEFARVEATTVMAAAQGRTRGGTLTAQVTLIRPGEGRNQGVAKQELLLI